MDQGLDVQKITDADRSDTQSADAALLAMLADGGMYSGPRLATVLDLSPSLVRRRIGQLRVQGLPIIAVTGRGYQLPWPLELLDRERILAALPEPCRQALAGIGILWRPSSTSDVLRSQAGALGALPAVVLAESQSAGRGRRGRTWLSPPGLNICLSIGRRFDSAVAGLAGLSLAVGVMVVRALSDLGCTGPGLKWPNDVRVGTAKLAGILVEVEGDRFNGTRAIVGVGLNLRLPGPLRSAAGQPVTDVTELMQGEPPSRNAAAAALIDHLWRGLETFAKQGFAGFADDYARHDQLFGQELIVHAAQGEWRGRGAGVDRHGALRIDTGSGVVSLASADVSVRGA